MKATKTSILVVTVAMLVAQGAMADCRRTNTCEDKPNSGQFGMQQRADSNPTTADAAVAAEADALNKMASRPRNGQGAPNAEKKEETKSWGDIARAFFAWLAGLLPSSEKAPQEQANEMAAKPGRDVRPLSDSDQSAASTNLCQFISQNLRRLNTSKLSEAGVALTLAKNPLRLAEVVAFTTTNRQQSMLLSLADKKFYNLDGKVIAELAVPSASAKQAGLESYESIYTYAAPGVNRRALIQNLGSTMDKVLGTANETAKSARELGIGCSDTSWQVIRLSDDNISKL